MRFRGFRLRGSGLTSLVIKFARIGWMLAVLGGSWVPWSLHAIYGNKLYGLHLVQDSTELGRWHEVACATSSNFKH